MYSLASSELPDLRLASFYDTTKPAQIVIPASAKPMMARIHTLS